MTDSSLNFLLEDDDFIRWVKTGAGDSLLNEKWELFLSENPNRYEQIETARTIVLALNSDPNPTLSKEKEKDLWKRIVTRLE